MQYDYICAQARFSSACVSMHVSESHLVVRLSQATSMLYAASKYMYSEHLCTRSSLKHKVAFV